MFHNLLGSLLGAGSVAALACATPASAQDTDEQFYALPAQDLSRSLREVATRSGRSIIAPSVLVTDREAPALSGSYSAEGAVRLLLAGSGLEVRLIGDALVVTWHGPGADVSSPAGQGEPAGGDETIVVTGTNIRGAEPTAPLIVLDREQIERTGAGSVEQLMRGVPQNSQAGVTQENFRVTGTGVDVTEHGAGLNLRGLGQRATLVLVNGRRVAPSGAGSFVDVSLIPLSAIERVEILTDGASAIYGSDAVGGVVNFIMRRDFEGAETLLQAGTATEGDGDQLAAGLTAGKGWGGGRAMASYEYRHDDEIRARDRSYTINLAPDTSIFPRERRHSLFGLLNQELAPSLELDLAGSFSRRETSRTYFFSGIDLPVSTEADARSASFTGSLSYRFGRDWLAQVSAGWSRASTEQMQSQPGGEGLVNRFDSRNEIFDFGLKVDGSLFALSGGDVRIALGAQGRHESYYDLFETGVNFSREREADRDVRSLFGELHVPIFSPLNRTRGVERLTLTAAARYEHYDRFGGSFDPELGLLWSPVRGLSVRASYGTSFRAPLLSESVGLYNVFYLPAALLHAGGPVPIGIALATGGTNPDVGPERSRSWTAGFDVEPGFARGFRLRVNYYDIRFSERIALPAPSLIVIGNPAFEPIIDRSPSLDRVLALVAGAGTVIDFTGPDFTPGGAQPEDVTIIVDNRFGNTAVTATHGIDVGLTWEFETGEDRFGADLNVNHIFAFDDRLTPTAPVISALNRPFRPVDFRARGGLRWTRGAWGANLFVNYTDGYRDDRREVVRPVDSWTTLDLGISYSEGDVAAGHSRPLRVAFHVQNVFDQDPPRLLADPLVTTGLGYDPVNATGRGRTVSLQLRKAW